MLKFCLNCFQDICSLQKDFQSKDDLWHLKPEEPSSPILACQSQFYTYYIIHFFVGEMFISKDINKNCRHHHPNCKASLVILEHSEWWPEWKAYWFREKRKHVSDGKVFDLLLPPLLLNTFYLKSTKEPVIHSISWTLLHQFAELYYWWTLLSYFLFINAACLFLLPSLTDQLWYRFEYITLWPYTE